MSKNRFFDDKTDSIVFNIVNQEAVDRLIRDGDIVLPKKKIAISKDEQWNTKQMTSKVLRGIQNGDSVQKIANSMMETVGNNENSAIRNARTMTTSAENHGRLDSFENLAAQGVVMVKEWEATADDRTRPSHRDIDGEQKNLSELFSNGCMFPGDGNGPPEEVWMCRCAMGSHIIGFKRSDGSVSKIQYGKNGGMSIPIAKGIIDKKISNMYNKKYKEEFDDDEQTSSKKRKKKRKK